MCAFALKPRFLSFWIRNRLFRSFAWLEFAKRTPDFIKRPGIYVRYVFIGLRTLGSISRKKKERTRKVVESIKRASWTQTKWRVTVIFCVCVGSVHSVYSIIEHILRGCTHTRRCGLCFSPKSRYGGQTLLIYPYDFFFSCLFIIDRINSYTRGRSRRSVCVVLFFFFYFIAAKAIVTEMHKHTHTHL